MKKKEVKEQLQKVTTVTTFCDRCNEEIKTGRYDAFDCEMELRVGEYDAYDPEVYGEKHQVDLCPSCSEFVFFELFPKNGINVTKEDL